MAQLLNQLDQCLLTLEGDEVRNQVSQVIGFARDGRLSNLQGQELVRYNDRAVFDHGGRPVLDIAGNTLLDADGQCIARVEAGDQAAVGALGAALLVFLSSHTGFLS